MLCLHTLDSFKVLVAGQLPKGSELAQDLLYAVSWLWQLAVRSGVDPLFIWVILIPSVADFFTQSQRREVLEVFR